MIVYRYQGVVYQSRDQLIAAICEKLKAEGKMK